MAGNSIASANVLITSSADDFRAGLKGVESDLNKFQARASKNAGKGAEALVTQNFGGIASALGPVGIAATGAAIAGKELVDTLTDISKQGDIASALGLTSEQFTGIAGVAKSVGEDTKEFVESLVTMGKLGRDAASGTEEASKAMKLMGIDANEFNKLRTDEQFFKIFESLKKMGEGSERTGAIMKAFGEDGGKWLLPLLGKAPEDLKKMASAFQISGEEMKKSKAATQAIKGLELSLGKMWRGIAIAAAPFVEFVAGVFDRITRIAQPFVTAQVKIYTTIFDIASRVWNGISEVAEKAWERIWPVIQPVFKYITDGWDAIEEVAGWAWEGIKSIAVPVINEITDWVMLAIDETMSWVDAIFDFGKAIPPVRVVVVELFRGLAMGAATAWDTVKLGAGAFSYVASYAVEALGKVFEFFKGSIRSIIDGVAALAREAGNDKLANKLDGVGRGIDNIGERFQGAAEKMRQFGRDSLDTWGQSATRVSDWIDRMLGKSLVQTKAAAAVAKAVVTASDPAKLTGALSKGSAEAYSLIVKNKYGANGNDHAQRTAKATEKTAANTKQTVDGISGLTRAIQGIGSF